jgi:DDE superfamily endonuclease
MEDVLELYERPYDAKEPVVGLDEKPYQLLDEVRPPQPAGPGQVARQDYEYSREGTCCVFVAVEPKADKRHTWVRKQRTRADFARCVKELVDRYPKARRIHLVVDNLNTHTRKAIAESLGPRGAPAVLKRIEFHYTPTHASWLDVAEIEISVLSRQCLNRRLPTRERVQREVAAWRRRRNRLGIGIRWTFGRKDARRVFPQLYMKQLAG